MAERIDWLENGTPGGAPFSPRFGDRYHSGPGGLERAQHVFLNGCDLPAAWAKQPRWCVLETGFGLGLNFLLTWAAWKADPQRPRLLHFVSTEAFPVGAHDVLRSVDSHPELQPLAQQLAQQLWGLLPGFHRLVFEGGQVLLTLCIGDAKAMLREQAFEADSVYLDGFNPECNPDIWDAHTFKAVARCCKRGTRVATWTVARNVRDALAGCGFVMHTVPGVAPQRDKLQGHYEPAWALKKTALNPGLITAQRCVVIGGGLAGGAVAASLARRGWQVTVLDAADEPAAGASALPAGVLAAHVSPDDNVLSRLSRSGIRAMLQQARALLLRGQDWALTGVLEHCISHARKLPPGWQAAQPHASAAHDWARSATPAQWADADLPATAPAVWHVQAGWIKPAALVNAWLKTPGVQWQGGVSVDRLSRQSGAWQALNADGEVLASAELVVLAAGFESAALAASAGVSLAMQPIRGQVSWALHPPGAALRVPPFPVNGHGSFVPSVPLAEGMAWVMGSSFERDSQNTKTCPADDVENLERLQTLLPETATRLLANLPASSLRSWAGVRCATPQRLPMVGALNPQEAPGLWVCSGMGSRGLTFTALCAELLAARLHAEPLPLELRLANALLPQAKVDRLNNADLH